MTKEEFDKAKISLEQEMKRRKSQLIKEFAFSNNPYKLGDIVTDGNKKIKIEEIGYGMLPMASYPECFYKGEWLKKDGKPYKNKRYATIYQGNIKG
jgi:hypothetical protein